MSKPENWSWEGLIRSNILKLLPYRCARDDYNSGILLDANENSLGHALNLSDADLGVDLDSLRLNRYPDPSYDDIKEGFARFRGLKSGAAGLFLGVGSDEAIDLLMRITCVPGKDSILVCPPTYGMYSVCANINDVEVVKLPLQIDSENRFQPQVEAICEQLSSLSPSPKLVWITSPGNPTGTAVPPESLRPILDHPTWKGLLVVDEAYIDFVAGDTNHGSAVTLLNGNYRNLVVLQTLSKGFGLAGIRLGVAMADPDLAQFMANTKAPYNIATPTANLALKALQEPSMEIFRQNIKTLLDNRQFLLDGLQSDALQSLGMGELVGGLDANFLLMQITTKEKNGSVKRKPDNARAAKIYKEMAENRGVVVRFRGNEIGCEACLRITVGTREECETLLARLEKVMQEI